MSAAADHALHEALNAVVPAPDGPGTGGGDADRRTTAVLTAARAVVVDLGIRRLTIDEVVRRSGVSRMTVYRRFAGRDEVVVAVIRRELETLLPYLTTAGQPFVAGTIAFLRPYVGALRSEAGAPDPDPGLDAVAETIGRVGLSLRLTPAIAIDLDDEAARVRYAREVLVPLALAGVG